MINWDDFSKIDMRVGTIISAELFKAAKNPSIKLSIDFGIEGIKKSSAQITDLYSPQDLIGKQVVAVINFPPRQIATMMSECLVLGAVGKNNSVTLLSTEKQVENGTKIS